MTQELRREEKPGSVWSETVTGGDRAPGTEDQLSPCALGNLDSAVHTLDTPDMIEQ